MPALKTGARLYCRKSSQSVQTVLKGVHGRFLKCFNHDEIYILEVLIWLNICRIKMHNDLCSVEKVTGAWHRRSGEYLGYCSGTGRDDGRSKTDILGGSEKIVQRLREDPERHAVLMCSVAQLCPALWTPWTLACQTSLSMEFSRQEYWSGLPFPIPGDLPNPGIEPAGLCISCIGRQILYHRVT